MQTVIDAIYENGVFKPLAPLDVQENQQYRLILEKTIPSSLPETFIKDPSLAAEIERRTTILPDGRKIVRLPGLFSAKLSASPNNEDPVADTLAEMRRERAHHFDNQWPEPKATGE